MNVVQSVRTLTETLLENPDFEDYFLVDVVYHKGSNRLEVFLDSDSGVLVGVCAKINRQLQATLDEENWLGPKYTLDVSSPGLGKPLLVHRQFLKNIGRWVVSTLIDGSKVQGELKEVSEKGLLIEEPPKKKREKKQHSLLFENIMQTIVKARI